MIRLAIHNMTQWATRLYRGAVARAVVVGGSTLLMILLLSSCYRDDLCFLHPVGARIRVSVRYEATGLTPDKSYIGIYNADTQELIREELMRNPNQHELSLEVGRYYFVVYNEPIIEGEYATAHSVNFDDKSQWKTFKAIAEEDITASASANGQIRSVVNIQDQLAVGRITEFEVTPDMITKTHYHPTNLEDNNKEIVIDTILYFNPRRVFTKVNLNMKVVNYPGWTLRRNNGSRPKLIGAAQAYMMGDDSYSWEYTSQYMDLINEGTSMFSLKPMTSFHSSFFIVGLQNNMMPTAENNLEYSAFFRFEHGSSSSPIGVEIRPITVNLATGENADIVSMTHTPAGRPNPSDGKVYFNDVIDIYIQLTLPERIPIGEDAEVDIEDWNNQDVPLDAPATLYFHPNGATGALFHWRYPAGTLLFLPAPSAFTAPSGYKFKHWNSKNDGSGRGYIPAEPYTMPTGGATLFAIYEKL